MVIEIADISVEPGREVEFLEAYVKARHLVSDTEGCRSMRMTRGIESPSRFVLLVEWDSLEAHQDGFRASERFAPWRAAITPFLAGPLQVEHFSEA